MTAIPSALQCDFSPSDLAAPPRCFVLVPCAGSGSRAASAQPKQYQPVAGQPMVLHTVAALAAVRRVVGGLVVLSPADDFAWPQSAAWPRRFERVPCGGNTRAQSVFQGLQALQARGVRPSDWVLVHDAARCLVTSALVDSLIDACLPDVCGGLLALPLPDTLKSESGRRVQATVPREDKWLAQTPQMFRMGDLHAALAATAANGFAGVTDEASAMEMMGHHPLLVAGSAHNFKVTYPQDFALAEAVLATRANTGS